MPSYAELHCHTNFSFLEGASHPEELVARAVELGLSAVAVTDHNGLYGAPRFAKAARDAGLEAIIGAEVELDGGMGGWGDGGMGRQCHSPHPRPI